MKRWKRILATVLTVAAVLSLMAVNVFALTMDGNTGNTTFSVYINNLSYSDKFTPVGIARNKLDATPVYCYIESAPLAGAVYARVYGTPDGIATGVNLTYAGGIVGGQARLNIGIKYSIPTLVYERGYAFARLELLAESSGGGYVSGEWSPDSYFTYTEAPYSPLIP